MTTSAAAAANPSTRSSGDYGPRRILLASSSEVRGRILRGAGIEPSILVSHVDEEAAVAQAKETLGELAVADEALLLARAKCEAVVKKWEESEDPALDDAWVVLGCDSVLELDGQPCNKPGTPQKAREQWLSQRGREATLHTGHWLIDVRDESEGGTSATFGAVTSTLIHFGWMDDDELDAYVATGEPLHVAGGCTLDGIGGPFIDAIEGDHHAVMGLSLPLLRHSLVDLGISLREVRNRPSAAVTPPS